MTSISWQYLPYPSHLGSVFLPQSGELGNPYPPWQWLVTVRGCLLCTLQIILSILPSPPHSLLVFSPLDWLLFSLNFPPFLFICSVVGGYFVVWFRLSLDVKPKMPLISQSSCLGLPHLGCIGVRHRAWPQMLWVLSCNLAQNRKIKITVKALLGRNLWTDSQLGGR